MAAKRLQGLRIMVIILLALLGLQYEFGMAVNIANPPTLAPTSLNGINNALNQVGAVAMIHASLGSALVIFSILILIFSLRSGLRSLQVFGSLAFLTTLLAAVTGLLFTMSGFQNNGDSHGMATNFLLSFTFYFLELYFLKPAAKT